MSETAIRERTALAGESAPRPKTTAPEGPWANGPDRSGSRLWLIYLVVALCAVLAHYFLHGLIQVHLYEVIGASSAVAIAVGIRRNKLKPSLPWWLFALAQTCFVLGDVTWNYFQYVKHVELPSPSVSDALYLVGYPMIFAGLWMLFRRRKGSRVEGLGGLIDAIIVAAAVGSVCWILIIDKFESQILHSGAVAVGAAYPLMDLFLLAILARLLFSAGARTPSFRLLTASVWCLIASDIAFAFLLAHAGSLGGSLTSVGWLMGYVCLGAAALHPSATKAMEAGTDSPIRLTRTRLILLAALTLAPIVTALVAVAANLSIDLTEVVASSGVLFILVLVRMSLLLRELERATGLERKLAAIVETSNDAIIGITLEGRITSWNTGAESVYGYTGLEIMGHSLSTLDSPGGEVDTQTMVEALRRGERVDNHVSVGTTREGNTINVSVAASPLRNRAGNIIGEAAIVRDITRLVRSQDELKQLQEARGKLLDRTIQAREQDRGRLAAEIHDGPVQQLTALDISLQTLRRYLDGADPRSVGVVGRVQGGLQKSIAELRALMTELHPPALKERGLRAALSDHLEALQASTGVRCALDVELKSRLGAEVETTVYRIVQEALTNVVKHSRADHVWVTIRGVDHDVLLKVRDDGVGFEVGRGGAGVTSGEHYGLIAMRERAEMMGGTWDIVSKPGEGTEVRVGLPMEVAG